MKFRFALEEKQNSKDAKERLSERRVENLFSNYSEREFFIKKKTKNKTKISIKRILNQTCLSLVEREIFIKRASKIGSKK